MASSSMGFLFDISADTDLTAAVDLRGAYVHEIIMPAAWTAASVVAHCCETLTGTYEPFQAYGSTTPVEIKVEAGVRSGALSPLQIGDCFVKFESVAVGNTAAAVEQEADRTLLVKVHQAGE